MSELAIREIQLETLKIIKVIDSICKKENLKYTLFYGSLIGAVRHKGFIPWDDDLDIAMPRPDYDKLEKYFLANEKELSPYKLFSYKTVDNYPFMINRICNTDFDYRGENEVYCGMGTFVDIYPIDGWGDGSDRRLGGASHIYSSMYYMKSRLHFERDNGFIKNSVKHILDFISHFYSLKTLRNKLLKCAAHYNYETSDKVACIVWDGQKTPLDKKIFEDVVRVPFEDTELLIPKKYDEILRHYYGDYMQLPPENERVGHHYYHIYTKENQ